MPPDNTVSWPPLEMFVTLASPPTIIEPKADSVCRAVPPDDTIIMPPLDTVPDRPLPALKIVRDVPDATVKIVAVKPDP